MLGNVFNMRSVYDPDREAQRKEEMMFQRAIEESKREADPHNPNIDDMTYEELLQLEEANGGAVSKGLKPSQIMKIPVKTWKSKADNKL